ncbi:hypothetical protein B0H14DRAFT_2629948 [Mycena olivaceomarginata]|nr:hypothetical protein B0H14DRAFT_2629948 [Mycena olivaceomarginata]
MVLGCWCLGFKPNQEHHYTESRQPCKKHRGGPRVTPRQTRGWSPLHTRPRENISLSATEFTPAHRPSRQLKDEAAATSIEILVSDDSPTLGDTSGPPKKVSGSGARNTRVGTVGEHKSRSLSPPHRDRHVLPLVSPVIPEAKVFPPQAPNTPGVWNPPEAATPKVSKSKEKEHTFLQLKDRGETETMFDELASAFKVLVTLMRNYLSSDPTHDGCYWTNVQ